MSRLQMCHELWPQTKRLHLKEIQSIKKKLNIFWDDLEIDVDHLQNEIMSFPLALVTKLQKKI